MYDLIKNFLKIMPLFGDKNLQQNFSTTKTAEELTKKVREFLGDTSHSKALSDKAAKLVTTSENIAEKIINKFS